MRKIFAVCCCSLFQLFLSAQDLPSPESFLGYAPGARFTPHYKIVAYFKQVAAAVPTRMKLEQYGETYEGRPLLLAFIASAENLQRLESIRQNNLRLAGILQDGTKADENTPAIVWLSYNVHGNEPASSEAAMKTLYELLNPANKDAAAWLQHVVVVIDPCINPDGRDRYVNWYNTATGKWPNPDPLAYEHREPWPAGRTNHYLFDLNRDWAWQTQQETRQRLKKYNEWLPQVHVDYHEQGYNAPYYFAPAAEPYHEVITRWQRQFQDLIGKNNAKYFDRNGWLYFTKERFDLFYPSYGDTYPMYNGAIGMTFEQGGISAGLAVRNLDGDTLTLTDRVMHHYTTGMSTVEVSAAHAAELIREFHAYFSSAQATPAGPFRSYVISGDGYSDRLDRARKMLDRNLITWEYAPAGSFSGWDYETGKTELFKTKPGDIVINANQPKSNLLRVLLEKNSVISDSATYDITAWSLPLVYGLKAYGMPNYIHGGDASPARDSLQEIPPASYAYAVRWTGMNSAGFLAELLKKSIKVRYAEDPFSAGGVSFDRGTLIITRTGNTAAGAGLSTILATAAKNAQVQVIPVASGYVDRGADFGSNRVRTIHTPRVALFAGNGVASTGTGEIWYFFEQQLGYPVTLINVESADRINWKNYDVCILPDGNYRLLNDKSTSDALKDWINQGGRLIALEGAVAQLAKNGWGITVKGEAERKKDTAKEKTTDYSKLRTYENRERESLMSSTPGAIYKVQLDNTHPLAFGYPDYYYTLRQDENVYEFLPAGGWNVGVIKKDNYTSGFTGSRAKEKIRDGLLFGVQTMGRGQIVYMADDPLFRNFWENGKLLFCNAVFFVGQ
ncbi:MAG TPA: M14 family metallopeptidase [Puia sp.]|nr:M14 family metallopeptidase [Puia sp.]